MAVFSNLETIWQDARYGVRMLRKKPGFTAVAVLTLALGIGANTAIFTLFDAVLLESLPVHDPGRLVLFSDEPDEGSSTSDHFFPGKWNYFSMEVYDYLRQQPLPFESLAGFRSGTDPVAVRMPGSTGGDAQKQPAIAHLVSGNYFQVLGVNAVMGRSLVASDDARNAAPAAVISYPYWKQYLHSDPSIVGKTVSLNGTGFTIVGVAPPEFFGERVRRSPDY